MMHRLLIVADTIGWAFYYRALALKKYAPDDFSVTLDYYGSYESVKEIPFAGYDVVFLLASIEASNVRAAMDLAAPKVPLVVSHNSGLGRERQSLPETADIADYVIANNYGIWITNHRRGYNVCNISNGVDFEVFKATVPINKRNRSALFYANKSKIEEGAPHDVKGYNRILKPLSELLPDIGIEPDFQIMDGAFMSREDMVDWYNTASLTVCASRSEGTPNLMLEGMACGCVPVIWRVGNAPEIIRHDINGVYPKSRRTSDYLDACEYAMEHRERLSKQALEDIKAWDWKLRAPYFFSVFRKIAQGKIPEPFTYMACEPEDV